MHKIDLTTNDQMRRFIILQLVIALFVILFTYKWALGVTAVVDTKYHHQSCIWVCWIHYFIDFT